METFYSLSNKYLGTQKYNHYYLYFSHYAFLNKIKDDDLYEKILIGGDIYKTKINDQTYQVDIFKNINSDNVQIFIYDSESSDISKRNCVQLSYSNNDEIKIVIIENPKKCLKKLSKSGSLIKDKLSNGSIMMNLIISYANDHGFKRIVLDDDSKFHCIDSEYSYYYELRHVNKYSQIILKKLFANI
jgi:hypothetical protein